MDSTVRNEVAGTTVNSNENVSPSAKSSAGFGKIVMFGTVPGIMLGAAGITAAASAVSDDFDAVVEDFKDAASDLFGSSAAVAAEVNVNSVEEVPEELEGESQVEAQGEPEVVVETEVETVPVAETLPVAEVSDEMSFGSAFAAARSQVGPEGVFEWRGNYYSTYTKEEWDAMDTEARGEYMKKYYETDMDDDAEDVADAEDVVETVDAKDVAENMTVQEEFTVSQTQSASMVVETEGVEVEFVVEERVSSDVVFGDTDGHETMFVDMDGDGVADYMVVDANDDGEVGLDEMHYVGDEDIMMGDLG